jgi:hypothetical protein
MPPANTPTLMVPDSPQTLVIAIENTADGPPGWTVALLGDTTRVKSRWHCEAISGEARAGRASSADAETSITISASRLTKLPSNPNPIASARMLILITITVVAWV